MMGDMPSAKFRPMLRKDLPQIVRMSRENMAQIILSSWGIEYRDEDLLAILLNPRSMTEILSVEDDLIGYFSVERKGELLFINSIQVIKEYQKHGFGRLMMSRICQLARDNGLHSIDLWVQVTNRRAIEFYGSLGYRKVDRRGNNFLMRKVVLPEA